MRADARDTALITRSLALGAKLDSSRFLPSTSKAEHKLGSRAVLERLNATMRLLARSMTSLWPRQKLLDARYDPLVADIIARGRVPVKRSPWAYVEEKEPLAQPLMVPRVRVDYDERKMAPSISQTSAESATRPKKRKKANADAAVKHAQKAASGVAPRPSSAASTPVRRRSPSLSPPPDPGPATFSAILGRTLRSVAAVIGSSALKPPELQACERVEDVLDAIDRLRRTWAAEDAMDG